MNSKIRRYMLATMTKRLLGVPFRRRVKEAWLCDTKGFNVIQRDLFLRIFAHARTNVPFYTAHTSSYPECTDSEHWRDFLQSLPVLTKATVQEANHLFVTPNLPFGTTFHSTSGTTGKPMKLCASPLERGLADAIMRDWYRRIAGTSRVPPLICLSGFLTPSEGVYWSTLGDRETFLNIYALKNENLDAIRQILTRHPRALILGYASAVAELARIVEDLDVGIRERFVAATTSEVLTTQYRQSIEATLCTRVYDQYGSQEGSHLVLECDTGNMHVHPLVGIVEVINDLGENCRDGEVGRMVVTGLLRRSMPLIRYELGDSVTAKTGICPCGLSWPMIGSIAGRSEDRVLTRDGRRIGMLSYHAAKDLEGIDESQLIQKAYDRFEVRIILSPGIGESSELARANERRIVEQLMNRLGYQVTVDFRYLDAIPREGGRNKFKAVVVELEDSIE